VASLACSTVVHAPPARTYDFLAACEGYAAYSGYLESVERRGDGSPGTVYAITASWWRLTRTVRAEVTATDPPNRLDWRLRGSIEARGAWTVDRLDDESDPASRVTLHVEYAPGSLDGLDLPLGVSLDRLVDRLIPVAEREARAVVERAVADLEGKPRPVDLDIHSPDPALTDPRG